MGYPNLMNPCEEWDVIEKFEGNKNLLVCIGDSWTWGDSLSDDLANHRLDDAKIQDTNGDYEIRKQFCYGNHLSSLLNADWKNIARPGENNHWIADQFQYILNSDLIKNYENVYYVICLTETGRELNNPHFDYPKSLDTDSLLKKIEQDNIDRILKMYEGRDENKLIICRNFTKSYDETEYHTKDLKPWIQVNHESEFPNEDSQTILMSGPSTNQGYTGLEKESIVGGKRTREIIIEKIDDYLLRRYDEIDKLYLYLNKSEYHSEKATKHPKKESHKLWSDYLFEHFCKKLSL